MKKLPLKDIVAILNGTIEQGTDDLIIHDLITRIHRIRRGALLFDLHHDRDVDRDICRKEFPYAIITDRPAAFAGLPENITMIRVADLRQAFWQFIDFYRGLFNIPVIGVTGTCGKTTTKEMIKHILGGSYRVHASYKSYNASFRNLRYLLAMDDATQAAVYEMGVAAAGDLQDSCRYFKPQVGVITNIGIDHLLTFGTLDAYIAAKAELLAGMGYQGTLVLNGDDQNIQSIDLQRFAGKIIYFGTGDRCHFKAAHIRHGTRGIEFQLEYEGQTYQLAFPGHAEFNVYNATAAIAAAHAIGVPVAAAGARLASFQNVEKHFEFNEGINGSTIIDDTWSTNPTSAAAALKLLKSLSQGKKTIAVLGKMALLGKQSTPCHYQTGENVAAIGIDQLIVMGDEAAAIGLGALQKGMASSAVYFCQDSNEAYAVLGKALGPDSIALVKTSMLASYEDLIGKVVVKKLPDAPESNSGAGCPADHPASSASPDGPECQRI